MSRQRFDIIFKARNLTIVVINNKTVFRLTVPAEAKAVTGLDIPRSAQTCLQSVDNEFLTYN